MKKFFTFCLMFFAIGILNLSAGYVLSGENVNGESWKHSSTTNTFTEDENGDLILKGVSISGEFLVTLDQKSWFKPVYGAQMTAGVPLVFTTDDSSNCKCATSYTNCTIKLTKLSDKAVAIEIISTDTNDVEIAQLGESWGMMGNFNNWSSDLTLTKVKYGVYEAWIDQETVNGLVGQGFKFRVDNDWEKGQFGSTGLAYNINEWNILQRGGGDITTFAQPTETYDKYLLTLCVEGSAAKFRIDGYKDATPQVSTALIDLTAQGYENSVEVASVTSDNNEITVTFDKGTNTNACKYYNTGSAVRVYGGGYFTVSAPTGKVITAINLTFGSEDNSNELSVDSGTFDGSAWTGSANSVKFTVGGTSGHRRIQKIDVAYGKEGSSAELPSWAPVFNGITEGGTYYGNSVQYSIDAPGAEKMDMAFYMNDKLDWNTTTTYFPYSNGASLDTDDSWNYIKTVHKIIATAYKGTEYCTVTRTFTLEPVDPVYTLAEFIGTEGKRIFARQMATVAYQNDDYLYLKDSSGSIVVYGSGLPKFESGDLLQNFVAEYNVYNGLNQLLPVVSSFENAKIGNWGAVEPEVITIDQVTIANQNKYVKINNVEYDATTKTIGGVTMYDRFKVDLPQSGKYNVIGIVSYYNNSGVADDAASVQILPIAFEEILPLYPSSVSPENEAVTTLLKKVTITFPENISVNEAAGEITFDAIEYKYYNGVVSGVSIEGNVATISLTTSAYDEYFTAGEKYRLTIPAGYFVSASGKATEELVYNYTYNSAAEYVLEYTSVTPTTDSNPTSLSEFSFIFPEWVKNYYGAAKPTLKDAEGNIVAEGDYSRYDAEGNFNSQLIRVVLKNTITTPGTYTLTIPQGAIGDRTADYYYYSSGSLNPEIVLYYTIPQPPVTETYIPTSYNPANGSSVEKIDKVYIYFDDAYPELSYDFYYDDTSKFVTVYDKDGNVVEGLSPSVDYGSYSAGYAVVLKPNGSKGITEPGTYTIKIAAGCIGDAQIYDTYWEKGRVNPELSITYTIKAAPLAPSAVEPADGSEVSTLDVITITFPEATTINTEAGSLTFYNDDYYTATVKNVEMSEDGLTATITSEAGYPGWVVNQAYTLNIPAGYFVGTSGSASDALSYTWTIAPQRFTYVAVDPAQGEVESLETIFIDFGGFRPRPVEGWSYPTYNLVDANGETITTAATNYSYEQIDGSYYYKLKVTLGAKVTTPGDYFLTIPADAFKDQDISSGYNTNSEMTFKWTIDGSTYNVVMNADPADGATVEALDMIQFSVDSNCGVIVAMATSEATAQNWVKVTDDKGNSYDSTLALAGSSYALTIEDATEAGTYTVTVPKKTFYDALNKTNFNAEFTLTYTIEAADPNKYEFAWIVDPAEGAVSELTKLVFTQATTGQMLMPTNQAQSDNWVKVTDDKGNTYNTTAKAGNGYEVTIIGVTEPGTYTVNVPKGSFYDLMASMSGTMNFNDEIVLTYTIKAEVVEDFTPVVNPVAGSVTKDEIKTTVLTFPSPIASFDGYDVRFAKNFGSVWFDYSATSTISEDKLSMTIVWDFAPEVGLTYTLELPAGCIVLENGAKNLETKVEYVVVEGPKDLAEFVVPAGINGYLNYNDSDINAWAPEFPFTVSTTGYNTIAFTATLPSLPTGLTSMEIVDDNNEVLVTLNQSGVAPLADGTEEYSVSGETTKEFVEGTELRFRFRFAHAGGVSETITFSYIVAGGNITGADAIVLDGNVIVRGNDIIAPEGAAIYTVSGIRVPAEGLAPGVYVVVLGNQAVKVMVK